MKSLIIIYVMWIFSLQHAFAEEKNDSDKPNLLQVEIIVFKDLVSSRYSTEQWPTIKIANKKFNAHPETLFLKPLNSIDTSNNIDENTLDDSSKQYLLDELSSDQFKLKEEASKLNQAARYQLLTHKAWIISGNSSRPVQFNHYSQNQEALIEGQVAIETNQLTYAKVHLWYSELMPKKSDLTNKKKFDENAFLSSNSLPDIYPNIQFLTPDSLKMEIVKNFQVKKKQAIRQYNIIQYIDSPVIGALLKLTPIQSLPSSL